MPTHRFFGRFALPILFLTAAVAGAWGVGEFAAARARSQVLQHERHLLDIHLLGLENAIARFEALPYTVGRHPDVVALLRAGAQQGALAEGVDRYLEDVNAQSGSSVLYVLDAQGLTLASSNGREPRGFVGLNFAYRPYFADALAHGSGRLYAVGTASGVPGYFIARAVVDAGRVLGVVVVKLTLDSTEAGWTRAGTPVLLFDADGIAFLGSVPRWKLHARRPLDAASRARLAATRQYDRSDFPELHWEVRRSLGDDAAVVALALPNQYTAREWLVAERPVPGTSWTLAVLETDGAAGDARLQAAATAAALFALAAMAWFARRQRERRIAENLRARIALEAAHAALEQRIAERTHDLTAANASLETEVAERRRAETELRAAQDELVQAAKLAVVGQMAAGITHELNQPLAALDALALATHAHAAREDMASVQANVERVRELVARMGRITSQLRSFARRSPGQAQAVDVGRALANALALLEPQLQRQPMRLEQRRIGLPEGEVPVSFDPLRLEQVLVNLLRNAFDAVRGRADARVCVTLAAAADGAVVRLVVDDNGPGVPEALAERVFDPFFTTKPPGEGLGLGLAISRAIAADYAATLAAGPDDAAPHDAPGGGRFVLSLQAWRSA